MHRENAFGLAGLSFNSDSKCKVDNDTFIVLLEKEIADNAESPKFSLISSLFKIVSSFSYGNSAPENGFSINKYLIQMHRTALNSDSTEVLRFVKDTISSYRGILNIHITKSLLQSASKVYWSKQTKQRSKKKLKILSIEKLKRKEIL